MMVNSSIPVTDSSKRAAIEAGVQLWRENTCITFTESTASPFLEFISGSSCWSHIGKVSEVSQKISVGTGCDPVSL